MSEIIKNSKIISVFQDLSPGIKSESELSALTKELIKFMKIQLKTSLLATALCCSMIPPVFAEDTKDGKKIEAVSAERKLRFFKPGSVKNVIIQIEVADTPAALAQGLMGRDRLGKNNGMLFVFPEETLLRFWMKETLIPLDIIFVSKEYEIIDVIYNAPPCTASPCQIYSSTGKGHYAIEVNAGFARINNIKAGDKVDF